MTLSWLVMMFDQELEKMVTSAAIPAGLPHWCKRCSIWGSTHSLNCFTHILSLVWFKHIHYHHIHKSVLLISKLSFYNSQPLWRQLVSSLCPEKRHNALLRYLENLRSRMTILECESPPYYVSSLHTTTLGFVLTKETHTPYAQPKYLLCSQGSNSHTKEAKNII